MSHGLLVSLDWTHSVTGSVNVASMTHCDRCAESASSAWRLIELVACHATAGRFRTIIVGPADCRRKCVPDAIVTWSHRDLEQSLEPAQQVVRGRENPRTSGGPGLLTDGPTGLFLG